MTEKSNIGNLFYQAFTEKNVPELDKLYHSELEFHDPAFGYLNRRETLAMWTMLFKASDDLTVTYRVVSAAGDKISVEWLAQYSFGKKRRSVTNRVIAELTISDGKIIKHHDQFNLHRWASQAIGITGFLLGWSKYFERKLQQQTRDRLHKFMSSHS